MKIVFIDPKCPAPYDSEVMETRGLGGTEATVIRIARSLAETSHVCVVQQNRRVVRHEGPHLAFLPLAEIDASVKGADHVIFIQKAQGIARVVKHSGARLWVWLHNYLGDEVPYFWQDHVRHPLGIICVSKTHFEHTRRFISRHPLFWLSAGFIGRGGLTYLHNPIDDLLAPETGIVKDRHKLVFFSSPHKGIEHVVAAFKKVHAHNSSFRLFVADPGYIRNFDPAMLDHPGITKIGSIPHREVMRHVQESLCVFYPQYKRPETFGLVFAEANAVGVAVLAHDFGSAVEVLADNNPPLDARDTESVVATLIRWAQEGPPQVGAHPDFKLGKIATQWADFLTSPDPFIRRQRRELS